MDGHPSSVEHRGPRHLLVIPARDARLDRALAEDGLELRNLPRGVVRWDGAVGAADEEAERAQSVCVGVCGCVCLCVRAFVCKHVCD